MPQENLSKHILKGIKKAFEEKETRGKKPAAVERSVKRRPDPRRKDWDEWDGDGVEIDNHPVHRTTPTAPPADATETSVVVQILGSSVLIFHDGQVVPCALPPGGLPTRDGERNVLAVGDRVVLDPRPGAMRIAAVLDRTSALRRDAVDGSRLNPAHKDHILAANIDQVLIVCTPAAPPFRPGLIDRYLVEASRDGLDAVICLNKTDLGVSTGVEQYMAGYERLGLTVLRTSAVNRAGLDQLKEAVRDKISLLSGQSGVGKSSLLNAVAPGLDLKVGEVSQATAKEGRGRHTTTSSRLVPLACLDAFVVDSPGIRTFGLTGIPPHELGSHFPDITALSAGCQFHDCLHRAEPGCAVRAKATGDWFLARRLESYRKMLEELGAA